MFMICSNIMKHHDESRVVHSAQMAGLALKISGMYPESFVSDVSTGHPFQP